MTSGLHKRLCLTFDVRHDEHLRLGKPLLEVVEVDGAVKGDEAYLCSRVSRKPMRHTHTRFPELFLTIQHSTSSQMAESV